MSEVAERYVEQIQTTAETLRRRIIAYYDGIFFLGNKILTAADRARDVAEPVAYDVKDYISNASNQTEPVSDMEKDMKNNIVELYLGISVLMLGVSSGELAGAFVFPGLLERIFDPFMEFLVLFLVPTYVYLNIRKNAGGHGSANVCPNCSAAIHAVIPNGRRQEAGSRRGVLGQRHRSSAWLWLSGPAPCLRPFGVHCVRLLSQPWMIRSGGHVYSDSVWQLEFCLDT
ncbi:hypothetical protein Y032_0003g1425 [Ancylostoma ceylanicum]|uniref:Uncharacterized protein n=1 Tax=Ancylostoma ceylanicum TaxID=53326 RepID=A0A016VX27_9BILA|nr:hypothetical protein Y032_0003g1425 [Ancylostoma ceylanicum]